MDFAHVDVWIFDLDNTLYPPSMALFPQIEARMTAYVMRLLDVEQDHADHLRRDYWRRHGTTLAGLMAEHAIDPLAYLSEVHDIDFTALAPAPDLAAAIGALPGRKLVHTNADSTYARKVLAARGLTMFEAVYGVEETGFRPKPAPEAFDAVLSQAGIDPTRAAFFEDDPRNLEVPHRLGMRTVLIGPGRHGPDLRGGEVPAHVQHRTDDLTAFLRTIAPRV
ncbi:pyrimidine 5'-nucleotidase [Paracoccus marinaquae]|uniref:Pyrimidine 5'-nucleotidase n=1 Tax=Paracoccus marinaquae TaxID=2841926 RepID=A0ABS6APH9_9RHOB|nr:pyrimidine 5'-nucleotidase [Paracoccus marinaquae]MBU3031525.1 pyrimidine 5'-nucleotidase [Paracoccus marinaquae]